MSFEISGTIRRISDTQQISAKFSKRAFVIQVQDGAYSQTIEMQLSNDRTDLIEPYGIGEEIKCFFNIRGREWESPSGEVKTFNTLDCWRIVRANEAAAGEKAKAPASYAPVAVAPPAPVYAPVSDEDDLPF